MDFANAQTAAKVLATVNGSLIPNTHKMFKLNWASGGGLNDRRWVVTDSKRKATEFIHVTVNMLLSERTEHQNTVYSLET